MSESVVKEDELSVLRAMTNASGSGGEKREFDIKIILSEYLKGHEQSFWEIALTLTERKYKWKWIYG